jgi:methylmalonyl-CoA mutase
MCKCYNLVHYKWKEKDLQHIALESNPIKVENIDSSVDAFLTAEGIKLKPTYT